MPKNNPKAKNKITHDVNIVGDMQSVTFSIDNFKRLREDNFMYVDKTKMIADILQNNRSGILLFTRPRRFGKSLNLSMLRYFFDMTEDSADLFKGLYIENTDFIKTHMNQYPVLYLNFKDIALENIEDAREGIIGTISDELERLCEKFQMDELKQLQLVTATGKVNPQSIKKITEILHKHTGKRVVFLVDEYDSVINRTYGTPHWKEIASVVKSIFGALMKSNEYLELGVLTGVSRIGKELGFSDMNNLKVYGLTTDIYYEYFGFSEAEVEKMLGHFKLTMNEDFYRMYNGYQFGRSPYMFNTASMLKYLSNYYESGDKIVSPYWINAATNSILKDGVSRQNVKFKEKLLSLLEGGTIEESIYESIDWENLHKPDYMFSLLIDTGYLCPMRKMGGYVYEIRIPNEEVKYGYRDMIESIIDADRNTLDDLCVALISCKINVFETLLNKILLEISSYHDFSEKENSYHNLMLGALLYLLGRYRVYSNRESGYGRYDIAMIPTEHFKDKYRPVIIEFKAAREMASEREYSDDDLAKLAISACAQIEAMKYWSVFSDEYAENQFIKIGIGAQGKRCQVAQLV